MSNLQNIPVDMQVEIMRKVAAQSVLDMLHVKATCKWLHKIGEEPEVYNVVTLDDIDLCSWAVEYLAHEGALAFVDRMRQSQNPEIILKDSIVMLDSTMRLEEDTKYGLEPILANLKEGVRQGHSACTYLYALLLLITQGLRVDVRPMAIGLLLQLQNEECFETCRRAVYEYLTLTYTAEALQVQPIPPVYRSKSTCNGCAYTFERLVVLWSTDELEHPYARKFCPLCRIDVEIQWLCFMMFFNFEF